MKRIGRVLLGVFVGGALVMPALAQDQTERENRRERAQERRQDGERQGGRRGGGANQRGASRRMGGAAPLVADIAPVFKLKSIDGKIETDVASFRGQRPIILFFGSYT